MYIYHPDHPDGDITRQIVVTSLVGVWGARLTINFLTHGGIGHEDWRYANFRKEDGPKFWWTSFLTVYFGQTCFLYAICLSLYPAITGTESFGSVYDVLAVIFTVLGILLELVADLQMDAFRRDPNRVSGSVMDRGLWRFSRHPNYLGEICFWVGMFLFGINEGMDAMYTITGPVIIVLLIRTQSIPMMEKRMLSSRREAFTDYMRTTSALLPLPQCECFVPSSATE
jgi:steroid 5-alpha reductase family enzyme